MSRPVGHLRLQGCLSLVFTGLGMFCLLALLGCRTVPERHGAADTYWSEEAVERRVVGHAHYGAGVLAELAGESPAVVLEHFRLAAVADSGREELVLRVADRMLGMEAYGAAVDFLGECLARPRPPASYFGRLALAYGRQGLVEEAERANREALDRDPFYLQAYQNLVQLYSEEGSEEKVLGVIREAGQLTSLDPAYLVAVAEFYFSFFRVHPERAEALRPEAAALLDRAALLEPREAILLAFLAEGYKRLGDLERAEELYRDWVELYPQQGMAWENLADLYLYSGNRVEAARLLRQLLELQPHNRRAAFVLGSLAFEAGDLEDAEEFLNRAILLQPDSRAAYLQLVAVQLRRDSPDRALATLELIRGRFGEADFAVEYYTALACMRQEAWVEAVKHFTQAEILESASGQEALNAGFYFQYGAASERAGDYEMAAVLFRKCLELVAEFAEALNYLGYMWADLGNNLEEALELIQRAVDLEPDNAAYLDSLGWVLFRLGRAQDAVIWLERAVELSSEPDPTLYDHLGDVYEALGRKDDAREQWSKALILSPDAVIEQKLGEGGDIE